MFAWISIRPHERWNMRSENGALHPRHLVVVQLHRVDRAAAVLVVLGVGAEDAGQQHARARAERVAGDGEYAPCLACSTRPAGRPSEFCHIARARDSFASRATGRLPQAGASRTGAYGFRRSTRNASAWSKPFASVSPPCRPPGIVTKRTGTPALRERGLEQDALVVGDQQVGVAVDDQERRVVLRHVRDRVGARHLVRVVADGAADELRLRASPACRAPSPARSAGARPSAGSRWGRRSRPPPARGSTGRGARPRRTPSRRRSSRASRRGGRRRSRRTRRRATGRSRSAPRSRAASAPRPCSPRSAPGRSRAGSAGS